MARIMLQIHKVVFVNKQNQKPRNNQDFVSLLSRPSKRWAAETATVQHENGLALQPHQTSLLHLIFLLCNTSSSLPLPNATLLHT